MSPPKEKPTGAGGRMVGSTNNSDSKYDASLGLGQGWRAELAMLVARSRGLGLDSDIASLAPGDAYGLWLYLRGRQ